MIDVYCMRFLTGIQAHPKPDYILAATSGQRESQRSAVWPQTPVPAIPSQALWGAVSSSNYTQLMDQEQQKTPSELKSSTNAGMHTLWDNGCSERHPARAGGIMYLVRDVHCSLLGFNVHAAPQRFWLKLPEICRLKNRTEEMNTSMIPSHSVSKPAGWWGNASGTHQINTGTKGRKTLLPFCVNILEKTRQYLRWYQCLNRQAVLNILQARA